MFEKISVKGILYKEMRKRTYIISIVSFIIFIIPVIIVALFFTKEDLIFSITTIILLWYLISVFSIDDFDWEKNISKIITFPLFISLRIATIIIKFFLKRKYPEIEEEYYDRWLKLKNLQKKIKKRNKYLVIN